METPKVLLIDEVHPILQERLEQMGLECHQAYQKSKEAIKQLLPEYQGAIVRSRFRFDRDLIDAAKKLSFIGRTGSGLENIDVAYAQEKGIACFNSPEGNRDAVGEQAIGMLLTLFNNLKRADLEVRSGQWKRAKNRGIELKGQTVGVIGYGQMGSSFAQKLQGFEVKIIAHDKYKSGFGDEQVREVSLEELQAQADIVSIHLPLTAETSFYANAAFFEAFQKDIYFINTARGKCCKTKDLVQQLATGKVKGACLDVLEFEAVSFEALDAGNRPKELNDLLQMEQVLLSPHIAGWTFDSYRKMSAILADKIEAFLAKQA